MNNYDVVIVGGGFAGIYAAWRLAKSGGKILLLEASGTIGGNLNSIKWKNYWLDNGTHELDMRTELGDDFFSDILGDNIQISDSLEYASTTDKSWTYGFEMPDYSIDDKGLCRNALDELKVLRDNSEDNQSTDYINDYRSSHGAALTAAVGRLARKYTGSDPEILSSDARKSLSIFDRPKLGTDADMAVLKLADTFWDNRLGVSKFCEVAKFTGEKAKQKVCYPRTGGLKSFCENAHRRLLELGVNICVGQSVNRIEAMGSGVAVFTSQTNFFGQKLFWSLPELTLNKIMNTGIDLMSNVTPVGNCFFAFEVPKDSISGPDYLNDFHPERLAFRYNRMGVYSTQVGSDGNTFVVAEVPAHPNNIKNLITAQTAKTVWENFCDTGFILDMGPPIDGISWGHPVAFTLPKIGWEPNYKRAQEMVQNSIPNLFGIALGFRGRSTFMSFYDSQLRHNLER